MSCYPHRMCICMSRCTGAIAYSGNLCSEWQERAGRTAVSVLCFELFTQNKCIRYPGTSFLLIKQRLWLHVGQSVWTVMSHSMTARPITNLHNPGERVCVRIINRNSQWAHNTHPRSWQIHQLAADAIYMSDYCSLSMYVNKKSNLVSDGFYLLICLSY